MMLLWRRVWTVGAMGSAGRSPCVSSMANFLLVMRISLSAAGRRCHGLAVGRRRWSGRIVPLAASVWLVVFVLIVLWVL